MQSKSKISLRTQVTIFFSILGLLLLWLGALDGETKCVSTLDMVRLPIAFIYTGVFLWFVARWFYRSATNNKAIYCAIGVVILTIIGIGLLVSQADANVPSLDWWR